MAAGESRPITDHRASAEYRRDMVKVLVKRAINQIILNMSNMGRARIMNLLKLTVNGKQYELSVKPWITLLDLLRDELG